MTLTYRQAGVDIDAADLLIERIVPLASSTRTPHVVDGVGGFAGLCSLPADIEEPLLVSGTDGVGTKLKVAFATGRHDTIGQDLVAMCVNDVITTGARPLFFLDYFGCGRLDVDTAETVVRGIAEGCRLAGCALLGGETAELPGMYTDGEYDLAGFAVGVVGRRQVLGKSRVEPDDELVAIASSGLHSNGYSLARRVFEAPPALGYDRAVPELGTPLADALLLPTRIYARAVEGLVGALAQGLHALSHITGGGIGGNLVRVLPPGVAARVSLDYPLPPIFDLIARRGPVDAAEMRRTFNLGMGMIAVVARGQGSRAVEVLESLGERAWVCGELRALEVADSAPSVAFREAS